MNKNIKIFISYKFTGEKIEDLQNFLGKIKNVLQTKTDNIFCSLDEEDFFKNNNFSIEEMYDYCNQKLIENDIILFFIKSQEPSRGMKLELDQALKHNKKTILIIKQGLEFPDFRAKTNQVIEYQDLEHLCKLLKNF